MGIPLGKLQSGVNANDVTYRVMSKGDFSKSDAMIKTLSEAINIQIPYNFERLLFYLATRHSKTPQVLVKDWMAQVPNLQLPDEWLQRLKQDFEAARISDEELCETIRQVNKGVPDHYLIDPHTAVAVTAARQLGYRVLSSDTTAIRNVPVVILSTASPCKFQHAVTTAVGEAVWKEYETSVMSPAMKAVMEKTERKPMLFRKSAGSLEETKKKWAEEARSVVEEMSQ